MLRIVAIVQRAQRNGDGSLSLEGAKYIRETITAEFGEAMAELIAAQVVVDLDHRGPI